MVNQLQDRWPQEPQITRRNSITKRLRDLEINLIKNAQATNDCRVETGACRRQSSAGIAGKQQDFERCKPACAHSQTLGMCPNEHAETRRRRGKGLGSLSGCSLSINQRLVALQQNAVQNDGILQGHRDFLERRKLQEDANDDCDDLTRGGKDTAPQNRACLGSLRQSIPTNTSEALNMVTKMWNADNFHVNGPFVPRPSSAGSIGQRHDRDINLRIQYGQRPDRTVTSLVRVPGRPFSRTSSRPVSANSISGRCAAIKNNLQRNEELLKANRDGIDLVVKLRREGRDELLRTLLPSQALTSLAC